MHIHPVDLAREIGASALSQANPPVTHLAGLGTVNEVFRVGDEESVVVRLNSEPYRVGEFEKEAARMEVARGHGVATPVVLEVGCREGYSYQVQSFVAGTLPTPHDLAAWEELGSIVRRLHSIPAPEGENPWRAQVEYGRSQLVHGDELRRLGLLSSARSGELKSLWKDLEDLPEGLSHGDLALRNVIAAEQGLVLVDWGLSEFDVVPFADLAGLVAEVDPRSSALEAFLSGYGCSWEEIGDDLRAVATLKAIDLCRWALDRQPGELERCLEQARWALGYFLDNAEWTPRPSVVAPPS